MSHIWAWPCGLVAGALPSGSGAGGLVVRAPRSEGLCGCSHLEPYRGLRPLRNSRWGIARHQPGSSEGEPSTSRKWGEKERV
jgi:hypothetical protein